jgi:hypothetical protein
VVVLLFSLNNIHNLGFLTSFNNGCTVLAIVIRNRAGLSVVL